jgi:hypothetical protein
VTDIIRSGGCEGWGRETSPGRGRKVHKEVRMAKRAKKAKRKSMAKKKAPAKKKAKKK